eukprot:jgi/Botrbrau1/19721/Bobra.0003s0081.1
MVHANLVSQGKLVGNTGTFNSVLCNLVTVSTLTTSDSFCGNIYVTGNLQTSGNVSMTRANVTTLVGQTATLTGNLVVPSANIASLQTGNLVFSNTSYHSNTTLVAPSVQTANLYVSNVSYLSNSVLVAPSVQTANLFVSNVSYLSNSVLVAPSIQTANLYVSNVSYLSNFVLVAPCVQTANLFVSNVSYLSNSALVAPSVQTANLYVSNVSYLSNSVLVAPSVQTANLFVSNVSYLSNSVLVAPSIQTANLYVSNVSYLSNAALVAPSIVSNNINVGNGSANNYIVMSNGSLSIGNLLSNNFGFSSISTAGIVSNSISASNSAYVINAQGLFQKAGNAYMSYPNLSPYAQLSQLSQVATSSLTTIAGTTLLVAGNVSGNYFLGNASQVTGLTNSQLPSSINVPGAIVSNTSLSTSGNVMAAFVFGNGSQLTGLPTNAFTGILNNNQLPSSINVPGAIASNTSISTTGNVTARYLFGNASQLTGITNSQLPSSVGFTSLLVGATASLTGALVSGSLPAGNVTTPVPTLQSNTSVYTQGFFIGDGGYVSNVRSTSITGVLTNSQIPATITNPVSTLGNVSASYFLGNIQQASSIQNSQLPSNPAFSGTVQAASFTTSGGIQTMSNFIGNIALCNGLTNSQLPSSINLPGNINSNSSITATGNISTPLFVNAGYFFGNGSQLTGLTNTQLPSNISCSYLTANASLQCTGISTLSGVLCGNINMSRGVGFGFGSITNADTVTANVGAFPGWAQANTYWLASTQQWSGASGTTASTYLVSGNLGAATYFG